MKALARCHAAGYPMEAFECWRSPERQAYLYEQGRTREGAVVTKATAWGSAHALGLACDIAAKIGGKWSWDYPVDKVRAIFVEEGLESLHPFENSHYQMLGGMSVKQAVEMMRESGLQAVWVAVNAVYEAKPNHKF